MRDELVGRDGFIGPSPALSKARLRLGRSRESSMHVHCEPAAGRVALTVHPGYARGLRVTRSTDPARIGPFVAFQAESGVSDDDGTRGVAERPVCVRVRQRVLHEMRASSDRPAPHVCLLSLRLGHTQSRRGCQPRAIDADRPARAVRRADRDRPWPEWGQNTMAAVGTHRIGGPEWVHPRLATSRGDSATPRRLPESVSLGCPQIAPE